MYLRLAFAVAAHLEPDILLVDEVLAVGDVRFQKRCLNKMSEIGSSGRTILFVSHNMPAVLRLCTRAILLSRAELVEDGPPEKVAGLYLKTDLETSAAREWPDLNAAPGNDIVRLRGVWVRNEQNEISETIELQESCTIQLRYDVLKDVHYPLVPVVRLTNGEGVILFTSVDAETEWNHTPRRAGRYETTMSIPGSLLSEGLMTVLVTINTFSPVMAHVSVPDAVGFQIVEDAEKSAVRSVYGGHVAGVIRPRLDWHTNGPDARS
jgi:lipopolysaccharide transport system ATP-binding protein